MKKIGIISILLVIILSTAGVFTFVTLDTDTTDDTSETNTDDTNDDNKKSDYDFSDFIATDQTGLVEAINKFTIDFYNQIEPDNDENLFYSGYSIFTALSMCYEGARNTTADEMKKVLMINNSDTTIHKAFQNLYTLLNQNDEYNISTANALWIKQDFQLLQSYLNVIQNYYLGEANELDFSDPAAAADIINTWVEKQTNNRIKDLVPEDAINAMTRLILTNAIYFKGNWRFQFDKDYTYNKTFNKDDTTTTLVETMHMSDSDKLFNYTETDELQVLEMSYAGDDLSMVILLPKDNNIAGIENQLTYSNIKTWINQLQPTKLDDIYLPKYKMETDYNLNEYLQNMGMNNPFTTSADFSGITGIPNLFISKVLHKAFVEVNEEGTEAAAATAVIMELTGINPNEPEKLIFDADHPFIFLIREKDTGLILFTGKVMEPSTE